MVFPNGSISSRFFPALVIIFLLAAGSIAYFDIFAESPEVVKNMPDVERVRMPENSMNIPDIDAYFNTKETIKKRGKAQEKLLFDKSIVHEQNPFRLPGEKLLTYRENKNSKNLSNEYFSDSGKVSSQFNLSMILMGQTNKFAVINKQFVVEGDQYEKYKVANISDKSITLVNEEGEKEILLNPSFLPLAHKSSAIQNTFVKENKTFNKTIKEDDKVLQSGNLRKQLKDVLEMYDKNLIKE